MLPRLTLTLTRTLTLTLNLTLTLILTLTLTLTRLRLRLGIDRAVPYRADAPHTGVGERAGPHARWAVPAHGGARSAPPGGSKPNPNPTPTPTPNPNPNPNPNQVLTALPSGLKEPPAQLGLASCLQACSP